MEPHVSKLPEIFLNFKILNGDSPKLLCFFVVRELALRIGYGCHGCGYDSGGNLGGVAGNLGGHPADPGVARCQRSFRAERPERPA